MAFIQSIVLAALQAFAEIFPVGAAAHFAWLNGWFGLPAAGPAAVGLGLVLGVKLGLLLAATAYFGQDVLEMVQGVIRVAKGKRDPAARLAFQLIFATLPGLAAAVVVARVIGTDWQTPELLAWSALIVGLLLLLFDRACMTVKRLEHAGYGDALILGIAQACAIIPGVGRIAAIVAIARMLGYERQDAARFAFLMSIPALVASAAWNVYNIIIAGGPFPTRDVLIGFGVAFLIALLLLTILIGWLRRHSFTPVVLYRVVIGANLVAFAYGWL